MDVIDFRNQVLAQRDLLEDRKSHGGSVSATSLGDDASVLEDIRDTLHRIEHRMQQKD